LSVIIGLAIWYLARPEPLFAQGETESTRIDIAARVSGRLEKIAVARSQSVAAGATLLVMLVLLTPLRRGRDP
jgi:HlyD family secretion protein